MRLLNQHNNDATESGLCYGAGCGTDGHAWVIDGALQRWRTVDVYYNGILKYNDTYISPKMLHCNWGWGGQYNGYYTSGIFNLQKRRETAPGDGGTGKDDDNYTCYFRVVTYNKP